MLVMPSVRWHCVGGRLLKGELQNLQFDSEYNAHPTYFENIAVALCHYALWALTVEG